MGMYCRVSSVFVTKNLLQAVALTGHMSEERMSRYETFRDEISRPGVYIDRTFEVDKHHESGMELHCVLSNGTIVVLNKRKYIERRPCFVTILFARPEQINRYYSRTHLHLTLPIPKGRGFLLPATT